ncbi:MAG: hypothetical protein AB7O38_08975, partial [Pirellulaceae bacterium]
QAARSAGPAPSCSCNQGSCAYGGGGGYSGGGYGEGDYSAGGGADESVVDLGMDATGATLMGSSLALSDSKVGYIDSAVVATQLRIRFDAAYDFDEPDRAEYFYSTWANFGGQTDVNTIGPNNSLDSQTVSLYYEQALTSRLSAFVEAAALFNDPSGVPGPGPNTQGFGDMVAGVKYNIWEGCNELLTFQLKNYIPTGEEGKWLTAGHYSIEPALLYLNRINPCWTLEAEIRDWVAIGGADGFNGTPYAGNVLRYGLGLSYNGWTTGCVSMTPVVELVGWSVLEGQKFAFNPNGPVDADGDEIVNLKLGMRLARCCSNGSLYVGYGTALTDEAWYNDIIRIDYRFLF